MFCDAVPYVTFMFWHFYVSYVYVVCSYIKQHTRPVMFTLCAATLCSNTTQHASPTEYKIMVRNFFMLFTAHWLIAVHVAHIPHLRSTISWFVTFLCCLRPTCSMPCMLPTYLTCGVKGMIHNFVMLLIAMHVAHISHLRRTRSWFVTFLCCSRPTCSMPCMLPTYLTYGVQDHDS